MIGREINADMKNNNQGVGEGHTHAMNNNELIDVSNTEGNLKCTMFCDN
jgi:hypothetical protein